MKTRSAYQHIFFNVSLKNDLAKRKQRSSEVKSLVVMPADLLLVDRSYHITIILAD